MSDAPSGDPAGHGAQAALLRTLLILTLVSGLVDAVSYLGLGRVFTANMTGNVVVLGFAAAGAPGFSAPATLTSLGAFLLGALCAGLLASRIIRRGAAADLAMGIEAMLVGVTAAVAFLQHGRVRSRPLHGDRRSGLRHGSAQRHRPPDCRAGHDDDRADHDPHRPGG